MLDIWHKSCCESEPLLGQNFFLKIVYLPLRKEEKIKTTTYQVLFWSQEAVSFIDNKYYTQENVSKLQRFKKGVKTAFHTLEQE